ncbi:MAG: hypothetical protein ACRDYU_11335 [Actinomycetes bacterium]
MSQNASPAPVTQRRVQVTKQRRRPDRPALDLRTPSGRTLPY